jgi:hypothetical protein
VIQGFVLSEIERSTVAEIGDEIVINMLLSSGLAGLINVIGLIKIKCEHFVVEVVALFQSDSV